MNSNVNRAKKVPQLRLNSGYHDPFTDQSNGVGEFSAASRPLIAPPEPPYSPVSRLNSSPERLAIPPTRAYLETRRHNAESHHDLSCRSSWTSDAGSRNSRQYFEYYPFGESKVSSREGSDEDVINTQTVAEKFAIFPDKDLIVFPHDVEKDDEMHNPDPEDKYRDCRVCTKRGFLNVGALLFICLGLLTLFIGYPVITFAEKLIRGSDPTGCNADPMCLDVGKISMKNIRTSLIDPDTPDSAKSITAADGKKWELVFSDEFNRDGRTFFEGDDPFLQAVDIWYGVTQDLEWYDPDAVTTKDGVLEIRFDAFQNHGLNYRSGMVQSWNQLCFTGGRLEASISLPGRGDTSGLWPGFWSMGNLGRPGYAATTEGMWPYTYHDKCDAGITANQSSTDGISFLPGMKLPACTCDGEDHPTPGKSRSAPEIDVIEASVHPLNKEVPSTIGDVSQSAQIAPFDIWYMPNYEFMELYDPKITHINDYRGGPFQQAISGITNLNNDWYDGKAYQVYAFEYTPGAKGEITWFVGKDKTWKLDARAIGPNGNIGQRVIPVEPMAIIMNLGMSHSFAPLNLTGLAPLLPAKMRFDYVRLYQDPDKKSVTCDPPGMETTRYIKKHKEVYTNPNLTTWSQTDYSWPKNDFVHGCG
ncbi:Beta-glucan synthesis-associated family protein [Coccidioides posadasii C735 delta SOWgp]|uniref:Beta-glucan synthesis-associated family protein n=1 Tax=Coccidioides posadasii (strain C735) TaxID=222929 RepID=C5PC03_COCP7|nr:Beta-glucan synthesis-associated family protein [Coccidioides posadasii C735 delta SOWgp]EER25480.1 Beta-glucan synthesis-associated family protein [Coccidioides posadasii C735 delta SOWgp]|eukprot:XP_003067625.1 Beta-glucan synthesis-associated family protein [Coccidioides posadasii C735 delta SOWgp]